MCRLYLAFREKILGNCSRKSEVSHKILLSQREVQIVSGKLVSQKTNKICNDDKLDISEGGSSHPCGKTPGCEIGNQRSRNRCSATSCAAVVKRDSLKTVAESSPPSWFVRWRGCGWRAGCCRWWLGSGSATCPSSGSRRCELQGSRLKLKKLI